MCENLLDSWWDKAYEEGLYWAKSEDDFLDHLHWVITGKPDRGENGEYRDYGYYAGYGEDDGGVWVRSPHPKASLNANTGETYLGNLGTG